MANELVVAETNGISVLGVAQYDFTVDGVKGRTLAQAAACACIRRAVAIEEGASAYTAVIRTRQRKVEDLSDLLVIISGTYATYEVKKPSEQKYTDETSLTLTDPENFKSLVSKLGIATYNWTGGDTISAASLDQIKTDVEYHSQKENTELQSEITILQNYMKKRDSAYATASTMMSKVNTSISSTIGYILG